MLTLLEGAIAMSMPLWNPAQFIKTASDGSWFRGVSVAKKWVDHTGTTTPVLNDQDLIGNWLDELGNRALINSNASQKAIWNAVNSSVEFSPSGPGPTFNQRILMHTLLSYIPTTQDVTIMATVAAVGGFLSDGGGGLVRGAMGAVSSFGNNPSSVSLIVRHETSGADVAQGTLNPSGFTGIHGLSTPNDSDLFSSFSFQRSAAHSNKIVQLYKNGVLVDAGPSLIGPVGDLTSLFIVGTSNEGTALYIKDLIIAFKKARPSDHTGYHQYALSLL